MSNEELRAQFELCKVWQDVEQWIALGNACLDRGYVLNAGYCLRQADRCKQAKLQSMLIGESPITTAQRSVAMETAVMR